MSKCTCVYETRKNSRAVREGYVMSGSIMKECDNCKSRKAQASKPIAAVHGWFHGECVIRALDPEAVLPVGMALYSQPQAQAGDGEAVGWQYQHEDTGRTTFVSHAEASEFEELNSRRWHKTIPLYTAPPAAKVNQQLLEALDKLISVAEMCDSWESFPSKALDEARAAIAAAQEQSK